MFGDALLPGGGGGIRRFLRGRRARGGVGVVQRYRPVSILQPRLHEQRGGERHARAQRGGGGDEVVHVHPIRASPRLRRRGRALRRASRRPRRRSARVSLPVAVRRPRGSASVALRSRAGFGRPGTLQRGDATRASGVQRREHRAGDPRASPPVGFQTRGDARGDGAVHPPALGVGRGGVGERRREKNLRQRRVRRGDGAGEPQERRFAVRQERADDATQPRVSSSRLRLVASSRASRVAHARAHAPFRLAIGGRDPHPRVVQRRVRGRRRVRRRGPRASKRVSFRVGGRRPRRRRERLQVRALERRQVFDHRRAGHLRGEDESRGGARRARDGGGGIARQPRELPERLRGERGIVGIGGGGDGDERRAAAPRARGSLLILALLPRVRTEEREEFARARDLGLVARIRRERRETPRVRRRRRAPLGHLARTLQRLAKAVAGGDGAKTRG